VQLVPAAPGVVELRGRQQGECTRLQLVFDAMAQCRIEYFGFEYAEPMHLRAAYLFDQFVELMKD